ncbi:hypothetical protein TL08_01245 [Actinoalloteichus hymeniacidonis]|uniref:Uncharacterized protein n=1 Tax=Actinoalloteichus hymeniacidonis TaxID=340345 RepID=A0AAC9HKV3_9PSEU|nr:hypothetical protein TL08_01245 [Actinoalloteichus hymeniacidonis]
MVGTPQTLCHELLFRLAGRLDDEELWRYRDWLDGGAEAVIARALPRTLLHERIGLTVEEHRLLTEALVPAGASPALLAGVLSLESEPRTGFRFTAVTPSGVATGDSAAVVLGAVLRGRASIGEVRSTWRITDQGGGAPRRVLLVSAAAEHVRLTAELQRVLRALGEHDPCVEVALPDQRLPSYHRAAWAESEVVLTGPARLTHA